MTNDNMDISILISYNSDDCEAIRLIKEFWGRINRRRRLIFLDVLEFPELLRIVVKPYFMDMSFNNLTGRSPSSRISSRDKIFDEMSNEEESVGKILLQHWRRKPSEEIHQEVDELFTWFKQLAILLRQVELYVNGISPEDPERVDLEARFSGYNYIDSIGYNYIDSIGVPISDCWSETDIINDGVRIIYKKVIDHINNHFSRLDDNFIREFENREEREENPSWAIAIVNNIIGDLIDKWIGSLPDGPRELVISRGDYSTIIREALNVEIIANDLNARISRAINSWKTATPTFAHLLNDCEAIGFIKEFWKRKNRSRIFIYLDIKTFNSYLCAVIVPYMILRVVTDEFYLEMLNEKESVGKVLLRYWRDTAKSSEQIRQDVNDICIWLKHLLLHLHVLETYERVEIDDERFGYGLEANESIDEDI